MSKTFIRLFFILLFVISCLLATVFFKPQDIFSNAPVYNDDYSLHLSQCISAKRFLTSFGKCWGYDPFFLAGFPNGALANADNKAWELFFSALAPILGQGFAFKLYILLFLLFYPLFLYGAARNFTLSRDVSLTAAVLGILFFHLSLARDFVYWGMMSYVASCFFSMYVFSLFYRLFNKFSWRLYIFTALLSSLLFLMHILSPFHVTVPILVLYLVYLKKMPASRYVVMLFVPIIILLVNSYWLIPITEFYQDTTTRLINYEFTLQIKNIFEPLNVYLLQEKSRDYSGHFLNNTFFDALMLVIGCGGLYGLWRKKSAPLALAFMAGTFFIFFVAFYGSHLSFLAKFQPERFTLPLTLLFIIPASEGLMSIFKSIFAQKKPLTIVFILCIAFIVLFRPVIRPFGSFYKSKVFRLNCEFPQKLSELLNFLESHTTRAGRILIEDSEFDLSSPSHAYYGGHFPGLFPEYCRREYLCGPRPLYPIKHSYASFTRGVLFEKDINAFTLDDLKNYFNTYNVKWIVCWLQKSKDFFSQYPEYVTKIAEIDKFSIYTVNRQPSFCLKGSGTVRADYNLIQVSNVTAEDGEVILAYHWMKKLKAIPEAVVERVFLAGDPVGFIKIKNPPETFELYNTY